MLYRDRFVKTKCISPAKWCMPDKHTRHYYTRHAIYSCRTGHASRYLRLSQGRFSVFLFLAFNIMTAVDFPMISIFHTRNYCVFVSWTSNEFCQWELRHLLGKWHSCPCSTKIEHFSLTAIAGVTDLVLGHFVMSVRLIWRPATRRYNILGLDIKWVIVTWFNERATAQYSHQ